jgi:hypothetical protein
MNFYVTLVLPFPYTSIHFSCEELQLRHLEDPLDWDKVEVMGEIYQRY